MTGGRSEIGVLLDGIARYWPVVAAAMVAGAVAMGSYAALTLPEPGFEATASVRVMNLTGKPAAPTADTLAAAAVNPSVREAALDALGSAADGAGVVSAAADVKDPAVVNIYAVHRDRDKAVEFVTAVRSEATSVAMEPLASWEEADRRLLDATHLSSPVSRTSWRGSRRCRRRAAVMYHCSPWPTRSVPSASHSVSRSMTCRRACSTTAARSPSSASRASRSSHGRGTSLSRLPRGALAGLVVGLAVAGVVYSRRKMGSEV